MKLKKVHVREFKSIWDSNEFEVGTVTCLVGKNEAGKTAILQALYRLNPIIEGDGQFDVTEDYPRADVEDYLQDIERSKRAHATVVTATFELEPVDLEAVESEYGPAALLSNTVTLTKGYARDPGNAKCTLVVSVRVDESKLVGHLVESFDLPTALKATSLGKKTRAELAAYLEVESKRQAAEVADTEAEASSWKTKGERPPRSLPQDSSQRASRQRRYGRASRISISGVHSACTSGRPT